MSVSNIASANLGLMEAESESLSSSFYDDYAVRNFTIMAVVWGVVGMMMGVIIASQLAFPALNFDTAWFSFGRLRPLHTNLVVFAFGGCTLLGTSFYIVQRTGQTRLRFPLAVMVTFCASTSLTRLAMLRLPRGRPLGLPDCPFLN